MRRYVRASLRALALGLFDRGEGIPEARLQWAIDDVESFLAHAGQKTSGLFLLAITLVEWLPFLMVHKLSRMSRMSSQARAEYLEAFDRSPIAIVLVLPKALLSLVYYEHPDALKETGYDGTCMMGELPAGVGLVQLAPGASRSAPVRRALARSEAPKRAEARSR
jgi:hypothetical protein